MTMEYLKNAVRHLYRVRIFTLIQVFGLAAGLATSLMIFHYVIVETGFDTFYPHHPRIYRLRCERTSQEETTARFASCCPAAAPLIRERYPEVEVIARIHRYRANVSYEDKVFTENRLFFAEPDILRIFPFPFRHGHPADGLREPDTAFISVSTARKYFGEADPLGRVIHLDKHSGYKITGVFEDVPPASHLQVDILLAYPNLLKLYGDEIEKSWGHTGFHTYLRLRPDADPLALQAKLPRLVETEFGAVLEQYQMKMDLRLQPLTDIHLNSRFMQELEPGGNAAAVEMLTGIAFFLVLIAWINDINLSTAIALKRGKEIGLRKALGAGRWQLMGQALLETAVVHGLAVLLGLVLLSLCVPLFHQLSRTPIDPSLWQQGWFWAILALLLAGGILVAGLSRALALARHKPVEALYRNTAPPVSGLNIRQLLVLVQFVIAICLITGTFALYQQLSFMKNQNPGFRSSGIVTIMAPRVRATEYRTTFAAFRDLLLQQPGITGIAHVTEVPGRQILWDAGGIFRQGAGITHSRNYKIVGVDEHFVDLFDLEIVAGRNFRSEYAGDASALLLNEVAVEWLGFAGPRSALGQKVNYWGDIYTVVGILKNYHQQSPRDAFEPQLYRYMPTGRDMRGMFAVRLDSTDIPGILAIIGRLYGDFFPGNPFDYVFLADYVNEQYQSDETFGAILTLFSGLAMLILALGLFGLALFSTTQRTREIAIRKVLGAGIGRILRLLLRDVVILLLAAFVIAVPVLIGVLNRWLEQYAERIHLHAGIFLVPLLIVLLVSLLTVVWQTWRTATRAPTKSLRYQ